MTRFMVEGKPHYFVANSHRGWWVADVGTVEDPGKLAQTLAAVVNHVVECVAYASATGVYISEYRSVVGDGTETSRVARGEIVEAAGKQG